MLFFLTSEAKSVKVNRLSLLRLLILDNVTPYQIIDGSGEEMPAWMSLPKTIGAWSPKDRDQAAIFRVATQDMRKASEAGIRQKAYDFWSQVAGVAPPVPHDIIKPNAGLKNLWDAWACFEGWRRPNALDDEGVCGIAYVIKPSFLYTYKITLPLMRLVRQPVPQNKVFVVHGLLDYSSETASPSTGVITHWDFVKECPDNMGLPIDWEKRYDRRLW